MGARRWNARAAEPGADDVLVGYSSADGYVFVNARVERRDDGLALSIMGHAHRPREREAWTGGQINDTIDVAALEPAPGVTAERLAELRSTWRRWHLNHMNAGCEHQRAAMRRAIRSGFERTAPDVGEACPTCAYRYGTAWLHEQLPDAVAVFVRELVHGAEIKGTNADAQVEARAAMIAGSGPASLSRAQALELVGDDIDGRAAYALALLLERNSADPITENTLDGTAALVERDPADVAETLASSVDLLDGDAADDARAFIAHHAL